MTQRGQKAENRRHEVPGPDGTAQSLDKDLQEKRAGEAKKSQTNKTTPPLAQPRRLTETPRMQMHRYTGWDWIPGAVKF